MRVPIDKTADLLYQILGKKREICGFDIFPDLFKRYEKAFYNENDPDGFMKYTTQQLDNEQIFIEFEYWYLKLACSRDGGASHNECISKLAEITAEVKKRNLWGTWQSLHEEKVQGRYAYILNLEDIASYYID